jgi:hypothetical protein
MLTLIFNTTEKKATLMSGLNEDSKTIEVYEKVYTVQPSPEGFYVVLQENESGRAPVLRLPIAATIMKIVK